LFSLAWREVQELIGVRTMPSQHHVQRWRKAMPQYHVGHLNLVSEIQEIVKRYPGLALAGNGYQGVGIPQCVRSSRNAVASL
jgi:protoporphyrinogen/coproporphyrinogen III oxidase